MEFEGRMIHNTNPFLEHEGSSVGIGIGSHTKPMEQAHLHQNEGYEYQNLPELPSEIKTEMMTIMKQRRGIEYGLDQLKSKSKGQSPETVSEFERLYRSFNMPTVNRLHRLGGLDRVEYPYGVPPKSSANFREPDTTRAANGESQGFGFRLRKNGRKYFGTPGIAAWSKWGPYSGARDLHTKNGRSSSSLSESLLDHTDPHDSTAPIPIDEDKRGYEPLSPAQVEKPTSTPTVLEPHLAEHGHKVGDMVFPEGHISLLDGDEYYGQGQGLTIPQKIETWNNLQTKLLEFQSREAAPSPAEATFQLELLQSLNLLGDHIAQFGLLPALDSIESLKPKTTLKMAELHTELLFRKSKATFFEDYMSVIPEIEFWESAETTQPFHRSIKALPTEHQPQLIHDVLRTILSHTPQELPSEESSGQRFQQLREEFLRAEFLQEAHVLLSALDHEPATNLLEKPENLRLVNFVKDLMHYIDEPVAQDVRKLGDERKMLKTLKKQRVEFQLVYYMIDFLDKYYHPIVDTIGKRRKNQVPVEQAEADFLLFQEKLRFLRVYLGTYRNRSLDRTNKPRPKWEDLRIYRSKVYDQKSSSVNGFTTSSVISFCTPPGMKGERPLMAKNSQLGCSEHVIDHP
ncbi:hypothetical protein KEM48_002623 [Puccinia striiformis f. sp. tritici PST-130]|nr:hypothetical protein KEM48_002623 [Puccinia striiformis f. sp. tritici PST-130]